MRKQMLHPRTAAINQKQKNQSKKARADALLWLTATFPHVFDNSARIQPLSVGIMGDILAHADKAAAAGISKSKLREAVVLFTRRIDYLACLKAREVRINLEGELVAAVTEEDAERAALKIKKRVEKTAKMARKNTVGQVARAPSSKIISTANQQPAQPFVPYYPERPPAFSASSLEPLARTATVTVKHKLARQYDPDAVARLKEKLGLSTRRVDATEVSE